MKQIVITFLACALTLSSSATLPIPDARHPFSLTLHAPTAPVKAGSELRLKVTLTNTSRRDLHFDVAPGRTPDETLSYRIEIRDSRGKEAPPTKYLRDLREHPIPSWGSIVGYYIAPGKSHEEHLVVTKLYDLSQAGKYTIQVARGQDPWPNEKTTVKSNAITITVIK